MITARYRPLGERWPGSTPAVVQTIHMSRASAAGLGWFVDRALGEPPAQLHPVAWFGRTMRRLEQHTYRPTRGAGALHVAIGLGGAAALGVVAERVLGASRATALAATVSIAGRMLGDEADVVLDAVDVGDLPLARARVTSLIGRDTAGLDPAELIRGTIESLAENTVDAVIAPLFWGGIAGAPGVLAHRALNTLDAMIGHRSDRYEHFGWAAARLDDAANMVPARLAVLGVLILRPGRQKEIWRAVRDDALAHPSPNGGVIEAAVAGALGVQLGGSNRYDDRVEHRGVLGDGPPPTVAHGRSAQRLVLELGTLAAVTAILAGRSGIRQITRTRNT